MKLNDTPVVIEVEPLLQKCRVCYEEISRDEFVECAASSTSFVHAGTLRGGEIAAQNYALKGYSRNVSLLSKPL